MTAPLPVDWAAARQAVAEAGPRLTAMLRSITRPDAPALGSWDVTGLATHLSHGMDTITAMSKGGEWEVVHVLHASDGNFPSDMATGDRESIEEERRLLYVAVTRARSVLEVNVPLRYHHRRRPLTDAHSYAQVSRFLSAPVRALMDETHTEGRPEFHDALTGEVEMVDGGLAGIDRMLADLWG